MTEPTIPASLWDRYPTPCRPSRPSTWWGGAGGLSGSDLWRIEAAVGPLLLRAWPDDGPSGPRLDQIHRWLDQARPLPVVPVPIAGRNGATWFALDGRLWELTPLLSGRADLDRPPTEIHLASMFRTLATWHDLYPPQPIRGASPGLVSRSEEVERLIGWEFAEFQLTLDQARTDPQVEPASRWLLLARQLAPQLVDVLRQAASRTCDLQVCIRDVRPDHFLFDEDRLTGLVDFGAMGVDTVATDLARLLGETVGRDDRLGRLALAAYEAVRPLTAADRATIPEFLAANALLGGARWVRWHFVGRRRFRDPDAVAQGFGRALTRIEAFKALP